MTDPTAAGYAAYVAYLDANPAPEVIDVECPRCDVLPGAACLGMPPYREFHQPRHDRMIHARRERMAQAVAAEVAAYNAAAKAA